MDIIIYWDLDDTLVDTRQVLVDEIKAKFDFDAPELVYLDRHNTNGYLDRVMQTADFMGKTPVNASVLATLLSVIENCPQVQHGIATHRGYHPDGAKLTAPVIDAIPVRFDSVQFIDPVHYRDKMAYLRELHGPDDFIILVDDNTYYDHALYPNTVTLLMDKPWNQNVVTGQDEFRVTPDTLADALKFVLAIPLAA